MPLLSEFVFSIFSLFGTSCRRNARPRAKLSQSARNSAKLPLWQSPKACELDDWIGPRCAYHLQDHSEEWPQGPRRFGGSHPPKPGGFTRAHGAWQSGPPNMWTSWMLMQNWLKNGYFGGRIVSAPFCWLGRSRHCRPHPASRQDLEKSQCFSSFSIILIKIPPSGSLYTVLSLVVTYCNHTIYSQNSWKVLN